MRLITINRFPAQGVINRNFLQSLDSRINIIKFNNNIVLHAIQLLQEKLFIS